MIKMLHCADLHLDSPFREETASRSGARRQELRGAFTSLTMYIRQNSIPLCLMAGDLFDSDAVTRDTVRLLVSEFQATPDCRFVIAPGNHDPFTPKSVWAKTEFPDNVYIFRDAEVDCFRFDDLGVDVYGYAFTDSRREDRPLAQLFPTRSDRINLVCAHGDLDVAGSVYAPISSRDIEESGMDYVALGHIHTSRGIQKLGKTYYGYSGCLEGRDFGECGRKGVMLVQMEKNGGEFSCEVREIPFSKRRYEIGTCDLEGCETEEEIARAIHTYVTKNKFGSDTALRLTLTGTLPIALLPSLSLMEKAFAVSLYSLEIIDKTKPRRDGASPEDDPTLRGAFYRELLPMLENGTEEEKKLAKRALALGLAALDGNDLPLSRRDSV